MNIRKKIENKLDLITQHNSVFFHRKIQISNFDSWPYWTSAYLNSEHLEIFA